MKKEIPDYAYTPKGEEKWLMLMNIEGLYTNVYKKRVERWEKLVKKQGTMPTAHDIFVNLNGLCKEMDISYNSASGRYFRKRVAESILEDLEYQFKEKQMT